MSISHGQVLKKNRRNEKLMLGWFLAQDCSKNVVWRKFRQVGCAM
jgi:hypothetical protein